MTGSAITDRSSFRIRETSRFSSYMCIAPPHAHSHLLSKQATPEKKVNNQPTDQPTDLDLLFCDIRDAVGVDDDRGSLQTGGLRERGVEDGVELFERSVLGLDEEEVDEDGLADVPSDVEEVELPLDVAEADWRDVLVEEGRDVDPAVLG